VLLSAVASADTLNADAYLALKKSLAAVTLQPASMKGDLSNYAGKSLDLSGTVNGIVTSGTSTSFILDCSGQAVMVQTDQALPECVSNGSTVRILLKVSSEAAMGSSPFRLQAAAYDAEVAAKEKLLAPKVKPQPKQTTVRKTRVVSYESARIARGELSNRALSVYSPYRAAIARFNPRLSAQQIDTITRSILSYSDRFGMDPRLVIALIIAESGFRPTATSRVGAMGLCQLMPGTARGLGVSNAYDPEQNIAGSIKLMKGHLNRYGNDLALALSAYNAGPGAVARHGGVPPYRETQNYIRRISQIYKALCGQK
jgi:soluble lytic murein transglycosylase-like protein